MELSYRLLQQRVDQDMQEIRAEMARNAEQQVQSLRTKLQKGIAELVTAQLTPVLEELAVLQTRAANMDALAVQVAEGEARRSDMEAKLLEIEEKEDNHIAYLEAQQAGWLPTEKVKDSSTEEQATSQTVTPPPAMPSTSQHIDTADSVASVPRH